MREIFLQQLHKPREVMKHRRYASLTPHHTWSAMREAAKPLYLCYISLLLTPTARYRNHANGSLYCKHFLWDCVNDSDRGVVSPHKLMMSAAYQCEPSTVSEQDVKVNVVMTTKKLWRQRPRLVNTMIRCHRFRLHTMRARDIMVPHGTRTRGADPIHGPPRSSSPSVYSTLPAKCTRAK